MLVHPVRTALLASVMLLAGAWELAAQRQGATASIAVTLRVLPAASFEGGATHTLAVVVDPGKDVRVEPAHGVRTRMRYNAPTRVVVTTEGLRGPGGARLMPRLLCAAGEGAAEALDTAFDCAAGYLAPEATTRARAIALGVGASVDASATRALPAGLFVGQVTLVASHRAY